MAGIPSQEKGPFRPGWVRGAPSTVGVPPDDASLSIYVEQPEHDLPEEPRGGLGFRIDPPPDEIAQQYIEDVEDVVDLFDYDQVIHLVESGGAAPVADLLDYVEDAQPEPDDVTDDLPQQQVESDATLVLPDDAQDEPDDFVHELVAQQVEDANQPSVDIGYQFIEQPVDEDEAFEEFLTNIVEAGAAAPAEIDQQFIDLQYEEDEAFEEFLFNVVENANQPSVDIGYQFLEQPVEEDEAFEEFLTNLIDVPVALAEIDQQFIELLFEEEEVYEEFLSNYLPDQPPPPAPPAEVGVVALIVQGRLMNRG